MFYSFGLGNYTAGNSYSYFKNKYDIGVADSFERPRYQASLPLPATKDTFQKENLLTKFKRMTNG